MSGAWTAQRQVAAAGGAHLFFEFQSTADSAARIYRAAVAGGQRVGVGPVLDTAAREAFYWLEPPPDARWQYQLQAIAKGGFDTGRVDVGICGRPPGGGGCLRPVVYDFDLYRDGRGGAVDSRPNRRGVRAVEARRGDGIPCEQVRARWDRRLGP